MSLKNYNKNKTILFFLSYTEGHRNYELVGKSKGNPIEVRATPNDPMDEGSSTREYQKESKLDEKKVMQYRVIAIIKTQKISLMLRNRRENHC